MENKSHAFIAGIFTVCLVSAILLIVWFFNLDRTNRSPYMITTYQSISGLSPQATVRFHGMEVGKVTNIGFNPKKLGEIQIFFEVKEDTPITKSTYATLSYQGVTGIASIELSDDGTRIEKLESSEDNPSEIPLRPGLMSQIQMQGLEILKEMKIAASNISILFNKENSKAMLDTFHNISKVANKWEKVPDKLDPTLKELPELARNAQQTLKTAENLSAQLTRLSKHTGTILENDIQQDTLPKLKALTNQSRTTLHNLNQVIQQYKQRPAGLLFGAKGPEPGPGEPGFSDNK